MTSASATSEISSTGTWRALETSKITLLTSCVPSARTGSTWVSGITGVLTACEEDVRVAAPAKLVPGAEAEEQNDRK